MLKIGFVKFVFLFLNVYELIVILLGIVIDFILGLIIMCLRFGRRLDLGL